MKIIPAILESDFSQILDKFEKLEKETKYFQIDIIDGLFANNKTWPFVDSEKIKEEISILKNKNLNIDLDLMVLPENIDFDFLKNINPNRVIFHFDSFLDTKKFTDFILNFKKQFSFEVGISFTLKNYNKDIFEKISPQVSFVQFMGISEVGVQGGLFEDKIIDIISGFSKEYPDFLVSVDGGVNKDNIISLKNSGVSQFVIGSAIYKEKDVVSSFRYLQEKLK